MSANPAPPSLLSSNVLSFHVRYATQRVLLALFRVVWVLFLIYGINFVVTVGAAGIREGTGAFTQGSTYAQAALLDQVASLTRFAPQIEYVLAAAVLSALGLIGLAFIWDAALVYYAKMFTDPSLPEQPGDLLSRLLYLFFAYVLQSELEKHMAGIAARQERVQTIEEYLDGDPDLLDYLDYKLRGRSRINAALLSGIAPAVVILTYRLFSVPLY